MAEQSVKQSKHPFVPTNELNHDSNLLMNKFVGHENQLVGHTYYVGYPLPR
jgi:hypothetical protein